MLHHRLLHIEPYHAKAYNTKDKNAEPEQSSLRAVFTEFSNDQTLAHLEKKHTSTIDPDVQE